jgi:hypothetical protein
MAKRTEEEQQETLAEETALIFALFWRLWDKGTLAPARRVHSESIGQLVTGLQLALGSNTQARVSPVMLDRVQAFFRAFLQPVSSRIGDVVVRSTAHVPVEVASSLDRLVARVSKQNVDLANRTRLHRLELAKRQREDELRRQVSEAVIQDLSASVTDKLGEIPSGAARVSDIIAAAGLSMSDSWWKIERVIRTRTSAVFNEAQSDAVEDLAKMFPGVRKRWTELVDDKTGTPLDSRVGIDSIVLHGQIAPPTGQFTMPNDPRAPAKMVGQSWAHPPNRPNDRSIITPWMPGWPASVYKVSGTSRVSVDYRTGRTSGSME